MADTKISGLAAFSVFAVGDLLAGVDVSDTSMAATGTDKQLTLSQLFGTLTGDVTVAGFAATIAAGAVTTAKLAANAVTNAKMAAGTINTLAGYDASGNFSGVAAGSGITISAGVISATTGGGGTVTSVALSMPAIFAVGGSPVTTSGTLAVTLATEAANLVWAGPTTGAAAVPTFRALVGADLPAPSATTLGGIQSAAAVAHQWIDSISTAGVPHLSQPAFTDVSGTAAVAQLPVMVASGASHAAGIAPDPGVTAGTTHFLREDATWAIPAGGGGSPGGVSGNIQYDNAGAFGGAGNLNVGSAGQLNFGAITDPVSPVDGDEWYSSAQKCRVFRSGLPAYRVGLIFAQTTNVTQSTPTGASLVSTTGAVGSVSLPAGYLNVAGRSLRIHARGYANTGATSGALNFAVALGANIIATCVNLALGTGKVNIPWSVDLNVTTKATGVSGKLDSAGLASAPSVTVLQGMNNGTAAGTNAPQTQVALDLTAAYTLDFQCTSTGTGNSITLTNLTVEVLA